MMPSKHAGKECRIVNFEIISPAPVAHVRKSYFSFLSSGYQILVTLIKLNYHHSTPAPPFRTLGVDNTGRGGGSLDDFPNILKAFENTKKIYDFWSIISHLQRLFEGWER